VLARQPLILPSVTPARSCPISRGRQLNTHGFGGFALGSGPAFPIIAEDRDAAGVYHYGHTQPDGDWWALKTLWALSPSARAPFLVRVARLDGSGGVGVTGEGEDQGATDIGKLSEGVTLTVAAIHDKSLNVDDVDHWASYPGGTYVRQPGCFAFQVDGPDYSYTLVFEATK